MLIEAYVKQMHKFKSDSTALPTMIELLKVVIIELIGAFTHSNTKIRHLAEEIIRAIFDLMMHMKSVPQFFQLLLVGFAGTKSATQAATIKSLLLLIKINYGKLLTKEEGCLDFNEASFQDFLRKVTKIIVLFLKDKSAGNLLHKSVLKYCKTIISFVNVTGEIAEQIVQGMFTLPKHKNNELVKKILNKLIKKLTLQYVKSITPKQHIALIDYLEREKRKRANKKKREQLRALLGQEEKKKDDFLAKLGIADEESDMEMEDEGENRMRDDEDDDKSENYSIGSDDESESEEEDEYVRGTDHLMADGYDIPRVENIPVVSRLAKEQQAQQKSLKERLTETKDKLVNMIEADQEEFETHFVENPFIKMRERTQQKSLNAKIALGQAQL